MSRRPRRDPAQPALALRPPAAPTDAERSAAARRVRLEPFYLEWRADRGRYAVAWYDPAARTRRRKLTDVGAGEGVDPPLAAREALAAQFAAHSRPVEAEAPAAAGLSGLMNTYLDEHVARKAAPDRTAISVLHWERFIAHERKRGAIRTLAVVEDLTDERVGAFIAFRAAEGAAAATINRDIAAMRGAVYYAWRRRRLSDRPYIRDVDPELDALEPVTSRDLEYSPEQVAAIFEACQLPDRAHVADFVFVMMSTHARGEAILECNLDAQYDRRRGNIDWNPPGRRQTRKHRSVTRVAPSLARRLEDREGKLIVYRAELARARWADAEVPEYFVRPTWSIKRAFEAALLAAHAAHPSLGLARPLLGPDGAQAHDARGRPLWKGVGSPNTFRHTVHTYLEAAGVPEAQIDSASGHNRRRGSGRAYTHLRPEYQRDLIAAVEAYWADLDRLTMAHRRSHFGPKIVWITPPRRQAGAKNA